MRFPDNWIKLILDCVTTSSLSCILNGCKLGGFSPSRSIRQGCPLSPYLFILCTEALSASLRRAENQGRGLGIRCARRGPLISHLFFTDDSILFCRAIASNCCTIKNILNAYGKGSGQCINFDKTSVAFSPNVELFHRKDIQGLLGITDSHCQDKYLGMPTTVGRNKRRTFNLIKERVWNKLKGWKSHLFSLGGKEILIKVVLQAMPTYVMSLFQLPISLCKDLGAMTSKCWWGANGEKMKISWLNWDAMCLPKTEGGLGFKNLVDFNQSLLAKQAWRLVVEPNSLSAAVFHSKYFSNIDFLQAQLRKGGSHLWRSFIWGRGLLLKGLRRQIGNGKDTSISSDPWLPRPKTFRTITQMEED